VPNFIKIGHTVTQIWRFNGFQNDGIRHLGFVKFNFLTVGAVKRPILHQHTEFRSNRCGDVAIFVIFTMAAAAILDFQMFEILTVDPQ